MVSKNTDLCHYRSYQVNSSAKLMVKIELVVVSCSTFYFKLVLTHTLERKYAAMQSIF